MRTSWPVACAAVLIFGVLSSGCSAKGETAAPAGTQGASTSSDDKPDGIHEYRAVCTEKARHDGNEIVLSSWLDTKKAATDYGDYHAEHKGRGHVVRIEERVKRKKETSPQ